MYSFNDEDETESDDELKDFNYGGKDALLVEILSFVLLVLHFYLTCSFSFW